MVQDSVVADGVPGRLMWVPDSLADGFRSVLEGRSKIVRDYSLIDPKEKVVVKGDTVPLIIRQRNLGRFDRGLFNFLFIPKGQWLFALTASYGEFSSEDLKVFDLLSDFDFSGHVFSIKPTISYFVRNNVSVGLRLNYTKAKASLGSMSLDFSDDMSFAISDIGYLNEEYSAAITSAQYIGLARGSRFGIFNEVELAFASRQQRVPASIQRRAEGNQFHLYAGAAVVLARRVRVHHEERFVQCLFRCVRILSPQ